MRRIGRIPEPTTLKLLRGNPGKRPINQHEAKPEVKIPPCPPHIQGEAKKEWKRISKQIVELGLLTVIDRAALAGYCQTWARWIEAEENVRKTGMVVKTPNGFPLLNPYLTIATQSLKQLRDFLTEFGLTPASRSRISATPPTKKEESKLAKYLDADQETA